jgi:hypothetical protein
MKKIIGQQGEVRIVRIDRIPDDVEVRRVQKAGNGYIISHSESGNHHVLTGGEVLARVDSRVPAGMRMLYAILKSPETLMHEGGRPHESFALDPGIYRFDISREYDPFGEQIRQIMD